MAAAPLFIDGLAGRLFAVYHPAAVAAAPALLYVHPFAEEMNRCRRMAALQARAFAAAGRAVLILDLAGCGDSDGEFHDARWDGWRADVAAGIDWLRARGHRRIGLWGLRLGALLAAEAARDSEVSELLLWQPAASGRTHLTQFLRIRLAAAITRAGGGGETTQTLRAALADGATVEVAGYGLAGAMAAAIDDRMLAPLTPPAGVAIHWLEVAGEASDTLPPASAAVVEGWRAAGRDVRVAVVAGDPFWATAEITVAPALIEASLRALAETAPA